MTAHQGTNDKYELLFDQSIQHNGRTLYRIRALKDINRDVKKGDLGGHIQGEHNLSTEGRSWVFFGAKVYDNAHVFIHAVISGVAEVFEQATVGSSTDVSDRAKVFGNARVRSHHVLHDAQVYGNAQACTFSSISGNAKLHGDAVLLFQEELCGDEDVASRQEFEKIRRIEPTI